jgi:hypothetical protein
MITTCVIGEWVSARAGMTIDPGTTRRAEKRVTQPRRDRPARLPSRRPGPLPRRTTVTVRPHRRRSTSVDRSAGDAFPGNLLYRRQLAVKDDRLPWVS